MQGGGDAGLGTDTLQDVKARIGVHQSCPPCLKTFTDIEGVKKSRISKLNWSCGNEHR